MLVILTDNQSNGEKISDVSRRKMALADRPYVQRTRGKPVMRARSIDGYELHCEETGKGIPVVFVHEFAGDHRSWEPQLRHFGRTYRCT